MQQEHRQAAGISAVVANALLVLAAVALLAVGTRWATVRADLAKARTNAAAAQDLSTQSLLRGFFLPVNRPLRFCNQTGREAKITGLTAAYWGHDGSIDEFNSADHDWHQWPLQRGQTIDVRMSGEARPWDGSAIFYAAEVQQNNETSLLVGSSDSLKGGACIAVRGE